MLDLPRYLLGVAEVLSLGGFAWLGASAVRARLLPGFDGAPAGLATGVVALALLNWTAELLGSFGLFKPLPYIAAVAVAGVLCQTLLAGEASGRGVLSTRRSLFRRDRLASGATRSAKKAESGGRPVPAAGPAVKALTAIAVTIAAAALVKFGIDVRAKLSTGMTGFDSTWYHGPFAAGFFQGGDTWSLHFIAPQFLAWFYPANAEIFHAAGMLAFGRDLLSPLLNLGWFAGCLVACWCIGRPYRVGPWSLALGAVALSLPLLSDQAGEARNDIVGIFFLLSAVAIALNAPPGSFARRGEDSGRSYTRIPGISATASVLAGLAAGLAAGTKLNFLLPAAVFVLGLAFVAPSGRRWRALAATCLAALAGGGYWYLRNLIHGGNPLPWFDQLGPVSLPAPAQALGGREGHTVLGYLTDGSVWSGWFMPGLHGGLTILWPLLAGLSLSAFLLCFVEPRRSSLKGDSNGEPREREPDTERRWPLVPVADPALWIVGLTGIAVVGAWLIAPTSASGPDGMPRGFESGLRYLAPALVLGLALLPATPTLRHLLRGWRGGAAAGRAVGDAGAADGSGAGEGRDVFGRERLTGSAPGGVSERPAGGAAGTRSAWMAVAGVLTLAAIAIGYPVQRHYLRDRYADPTFAAPGLDAAFKWANEVSGARMATTSTRQYPLFGTDLSNRVQYIGEHRPHGGFVTPKTCRRWRELLNEGDYDYVIATRDRIEPGKPPYPVTADWTEGLGADPILRKPPTAIFKLTRPLDPSACP
jgi:hypothetical protein